MLYITYENGKITVENGNLSTPKKREEKGKSVVLFPKEYYIVDLETTGFDPEWDEIIEICALKIIDGRTSEKFTSLIKPRNKIDEYITELTGITNAMVEQAPAIGEILPEFLKFVGNGYIVAHNANFDINFLYDNCINLLNTPFKNDFIDTMRLSKKLYPTMKHHRLKDFIKLFDIKVQQHRAEGDCIATLELFNKIHSDVISQFATEEDFINQFNKRKKTFSQRWNELEFSPENIDPENPFYEKVCVFTGELNLSRTHYMQILKNLGADVKNGITSKTDYLILGNYENCRGIKGEKSSKLIAAEQKKLNGQDIEIISENVFYDMINEN